MSLFEICQWLQDSGPATALRESRYMFPLVETTHVLGLTISVGLILMTDLRLIGAALRRESVADVTKQLRPWMLSGFLVMFLSGALLFYCEAAKVYDSPTFRVKLIFLLLAGINAFVFETTVGRNVLEWNQAVPPRAKLAGWVSLICWTGVIVFGRWTAYGLN